MWKYDTAKVPLLQIKPMKLKIVMFLKRLKANLGFEIDKAVPSTKESSISGTHWKKLPNVKAFSVSSTQSNAIFELLGIKKKNKPKITWKPHRNALYNRYMAKQIRRLRGFKSDPYKFFRIMFFLMRRSKVFRVSVINKSITKWYKSMPLGEIMKINRNVNKMIDSNYRNLNYKRVYIPKQDGWRPLGVPTLEWRILLQMVNNFLYIFLEDRFLSSQHGFIPGKWSLTGWQELFKIEGAKYIYEFDLEKYFDNVNIIQISKFLQSMGVPLKFVGWLAFVNFCTWN